MSPPPSDGISGRCGTPSPAVLVHGGRASRSPLFLPHSFTYPSPEVLAHASQTLHDRIIVQRLEDSQRTGAIVIPDSAKEKPQHGKVLAAGLGKPGDDGTRQPLDVKAGDTILFGKYAGQEVSVDGVEYLIMKEDDVLAIQKRSL